MTTRAVTLTFLLLVLMRSSAYAQVVPGAEDACIEALGYLGCEALGHPPGAQQQVVVYWAALAVSGSTLRAGASHGEPTQAKAEETALANCRRQGATDCHVEQWAWNKCLGLAISYPGGPFRADAGANRDVAATGALAQCRRSGGKNCVLVAAPCAQDNPRWSAPLPLPSGTSGTRVDPTIAGTWELIKNPGRWIWRISRAGTYEFHSEAGDGAPSHAGTVSVSDGTWSIHAVNIAYDDGGTYTLQGSATMVGTGKLGTGTWHRLPSGGE